jgi:predicted O-methyltransferase YrrM
VKVNERTAQVQQVRRRLAEDGPGWTRDNEGDFGRVALPQADCDLLRDLLIDERVGSVVEVGLAYGSSALAIGEALVAAGSADARHVVIDPFQADVWANVGWDLMCAAGLDAIAALLLAQSSIALPGLVSDGLVVDAAFVDGSHRFHEVFLDFYYLRKIVRPGGLIIIDDSNEPSVRTAARYYERNLGWVALPDALAAGTWRRIGGDPENESVPRCRAFRLPSILSEPPYDDFHPF